MFSGVFFHVPKVFDGFLMVLMVLYLWMFSGMFHGFKVFQVFF